MVANQLIHVVLGGVNVIPIAMHAMSDAMYGIVNVINVTLNAMEVIFLPCMWLPMAYMVAAVYCLTRPDDPKS